MEDLQDMFAEIRARLVKIEEDERYHYPPAKVEVNAPLALIQVQLKAQRQALMAILDFWKLDFKPCGGCQVKPGKRHISGCDWERCPFCGEQIIACGCIYEVNGMSYGMLEAEHPEVYGGGPTKEMEEKFDRAIEEGPGWVLYMGDYHGSDFAASQGLYSRWGEKRPSRPNGGPWILCDRSHPNATPALNDGAVISRWDAERKRYVKR